MNRRTFFANLLGGSVAALWPYPPKPIICEAVPPEVAWWNSAHPDAYKVRVTTTFPSGSAHRPLRVEERAWPEGESLAFRPKDVRVIDPATQIIR